MVLPSLRGRRRGRLSGLEQDPRVGPRRARRPTPCAGGCGCIDALKRMECAPLQVESFPLPCERWPSLLGEDPRSWLLAADDPAARWLTLTGLLDLSTQHPAVQQAH